MVNQMATNNQIWFARSLKMLCKPLSTVSKHTPTSEKSTIRSPSSTNQEVQNDKQLRQVNILDREVPWRLQSTLGLPRFEHDGEQGHANINVCNPHMSNYLASMYPFPWSAADFDVFDTNTYQEFFTDHALDTFDISGTFEAPLQEYPTSLAQPVEERTQEPSMTPPHLWR